MSDHELAPAPAAGASLRWIAALGAALLVAGCGTRLDDARIEAAAGVGQSAAGASAAAPAGEAAASGDSTAGMTGDGAVDTTEAQAATAVVGAGNPAATPVAAKPAVGSGTATRSGGTTTRAGGGAAAPANAPTGSGAPATPGAPTPTPGAVGGPTQTASKPTIVLGHVGDYSGVVGTATRNGNVMVQVVANWLNEHGGLNGHPVRVVTADAGGDPARAAALVRDMVEQAGAVAFVGNIWPLSGSGARDYLEHRQIPVIGGDSNSNYWFQSPMYFPSGASIPTSAVGAAKLAAAAGRSKVAVVYCVEAQACKLWRDAIAGRAGSVGATVVYQAQVSLAQPDFTAECLQAQRNGAEAVLAGLDSASISRVARACRQQGYRPGFYTGGLATTAATAEDPNLDGLAVSLQTFPFVADDLPGAREQRAAIERFAPTMETSTTTAAVWVAGMLLREVGQQLPGAVSPADFVKALHQIRNNTLGGLAPPLTYIAGQPTPEPRCFFTAIVKQRQYTAPYGSKQDCV